jgi:hypothetical protein
MPTIREAVAALDERSFVDRDRELALFRSWLASGASGASIFGVSGPGGMGKSTLLRAFRRAAEAGGWRVVLADGSTFKPTPAQLSLAITGARGQDSTAYLNTEPTILMLDSFDEFGPLTHHLRDQFFPGLDRHVKLVLSGRQSLGGAWSSWAPAVRSIVLSGFSLKARSTYLRLRGVDDEVAVQIIAAAAGNPLALSLAADMATQFGVRHFPAAAEWRLAVRGLVEELLRDATDHDLRLLLEAAAVVRQFDEELLAAVIGKNDITASFAALCRLSCIRPAEHGLMLHPDIRRIVIEDLRWRRPELLIALRRRAWRHYRRRMRESPRAWMIADELYLSGNDLVQAVLARGDPGTVWGERAGPSEIDPIVTVLRAFASRGPSLGEAPTPDEVEPQFVTALLRTPAARVTVARDRGGGVSGYAFVLPICRQTLGLLPEHGSIRRLVEAASSAPETADLPEDCEDATTFFLSTIVHEGELSPDISAALVRDVLDVLLAGGRYLASTASEQYATLLQAVGFAKIDAELGPSAFDAGRPLDGFSLDLRLLGVDGWLDSIVLGQPVSPPIPVADISREVQFVFLHWGDDAELEASPLLAAAVRRDPEADVTPADAVRTLIRDALERARAGAAEDRALAFRAVELAYLEHSVSHERLAERLNVSRSTFYRLLKRGLAGVVAALGRP